MKISELPILESIRRDAVFPVAVEGEDYGMELSQILASNSSIVKFGTVVQYEDSVTDGFPPESVMSGGKSVVFNSYSNRFMFAVLYNHQLLVYSRWNTYGQFYDADGTIRKNCLFMAVNGRIYFFDGTTLKSAGITDEQSDAITCANPIEVASEEEMDQLIESGEYKEGQLYFLAES